MDRAEAIARTVTAKPYADILTYLAWLSPGAARVEDIWGSIGWPTANKYQVIQRMPKLLKLGLVKHDGRHSRRLYWISETGEKVMGAIK